MSKITIFLSEEPLTNKLQCKICCGGSGNAEANQDDESSWWNRLIGQKGGRTGHWDIQAFRVKVGGQF